MTRHVVLFLCTENSARSQMAEGLLRHHAGDRFEVFSAGYEPKGIHPLTVTVMEEMGIPLKGHRSKSVDEYLGKLAVRYAIVVCEKVEKNCPRLWPFAVTRLYWQFADPVVDVAPSSVTLQRFRDIRDAISNRIQSWLENDCLT